MKHRPLLLAALALTATLRGDVQEKTSIRYARQAAAMLGPTLWKRVLHVQNSPADGRYPASFGAVVFEMGGILWFYTSTDGTQSLSLRLGRAREDEQDLGPLLTHLDLGFSHWEYDFGGASRDEKDAVPPNACFIQSVALLRYRLLTGGKADNARLLSYYVNFPTGIKGHTVLYIETDRGPTIIDPLMQRKPLRIRSTNLADPMSVASCIRNDIALARWVPIGPNDFATNRPGSGQFANNQNGDAMHHS